MLNFFKDAISFGKFKFCEKKYTFCFFTENEYLLKYLAEKIRKKNKNKTVIISFKKISEKNYPQKIFVIKTKFFQELFFLTLKIKFFYCSTPGLSTGIFKKSKLSDVKYIYIQHSNIGLNMAYEENSFDKFDILQVVNTFQYNDANEIKKNNNSKFIIVKTKYYFLENLNFKEKVVNNKYCLIAPTWNTNFFKSNIIETINKIMTKNNIKIKIRPHPMSFKYDWENLEKYKNTYEFDNNKTINFNEIEYLVTDWSGIFIEYCLLFRKKGILIETEKKIRNLNYKNYSTIPSEIACRKNMGYTLKINNINKIDSFIKDKKYLLSEEDNKFINKNFINFNNFRKF